MNRLPGVGAPRYLRWATFALLILFLLLAGGAGQISSTADEFAYIAGGYALASGETGVIDVLTQRGYPPLMPAIQGALIYRLESRVAVSDLAGWPDSFDVFAGSFREALVSPYRTLFVGRMPAIWFTVLMAAVVFRWARTAFGYPAGVIALGLLLVDPTLLAHGRLATTDAGITFFGVASLYCAWRWTRAGGWRWALACGALSGATLLTKISGLLWLGCACILLAGGVVRRRRLVSPLTAMLQAASTVVTAFLILWAVYGFHWGPVSDIGPSVPAPAYWRSALYLTGYETIHYALGEWQHENSWWYYPLAFVIKNPLPMLLLWFGGMAVLVSDLPLRRPGHVWGSEHSRLALATLLLFPMVYVSTAVSQGLNIGYRHMLPIHPLLHIAAAGGLAVAWHRRALIWRRSIAGFWIWCAVSTWRTYPNEIAFFSVLMGGPTEGYHYLVDSDLDWGQSTYQLNRYLAAHPDVRHAPPDRKLNPAPGKYIMGASELQGIGLADIYAYEWFRHTGPIEQVAYGLLVYDVPEFSPAWVAQCDTPLSLLTAGEVEKGIGQGIRVVGFDCTESWLVPSGGVVAGIYALSTDLLLDAPREFPSMPSRPPVARNRQLGAWLDPLRLAYLDREAPLPFALYEHVPAVDGAGSLADGRAVGEDAVVWGPRITDGCYGVPAETLPTMITGAVRCTTCTSDDPSPTSCPCSTDGPLEFLGITGMAYDDEVAVETWWRVKAAPITRNFSIMAHLIDATGGVLGTADGLGVWPTSLQTGDVFAQLHRFTRPETSSQVWFRTGGYWLDTMDRWQVGQDPSADAFLFALDLAPDPGNGESRP